MTTQELLAIAHRIDQVTADVEALAGQVPNGALYLQNAASLLRDANRQLNEPLAEAVRAEAETSVMRSLEQLQSAIDSNTLALKTLTDS